MAQREAQTLSSCRTVPFGSQSKSYQLKPASGFHSAYAYRSSCVQPTKRVVTITLLYVRYGESESSWWQCRPREQAAVALESPKIAQSDPAEDMSWCYRRPRRYLSCAAAPSEILARALHARAMSTLRSHRD